MRRTIAAKRSGIINDSSKLLRMKVRDPIVEAAYKKELAKARRDGSLTSLLSVDKPACRAVRIARELVQ
jgi:hypothetical protein